MKTTGRLFIVAATAFFVLLCQASDKPDYYVEYIQYGAQYTQPAPYIDTGVRATPLTRLSMDVEFGNTVNASQIGLFGVHYITVSPKFCFCAYIGDGATKNIDFKYVDGNWNSSSVSTVDNKLSRLTVTMDGHGKTVDFSVTSNNVDGTVQALYSTTLSKTHSWAGDYQSQHTIPLFDIWKSSAGATNRMNRSLAAKLYGCTISTNGVPLRNFKPAVKNSVAGLWDEIEGRFYASASAASFLAGPKVKEGLSIIFR